MIEQLKVPSKLECVVHFSSFSGVIERKYQSQYNLCPALFIITVNYLSVLLSHAVNASIDLLKQRILVSWVNFIMVVLNSLHLHLKMFHTMRESNFASC